MSFLPDYFEYLVRERGESQGTASERLSLAQNVGFASDKQRKWWFAHLAADKGSSGGSGGAKPAKSDVTSKAENPLGKEPGSQPTGATAMNHQKLLDHVNDKIAKHNPKGYDKVKTVLENLKPAEVAAVEKYLSEGSFDKRAGKLADRIRDGKKPLVPVGDQERRAAETQAQQAKYAEEVRKAEVKRANDQIRKTELAANPLARKETGEVGWRMDERGSRTYITGTSYGDPNVQKLKELGAHWDPEQKAWWVGRTKAESARALVDRVNAKKTDFANEATRRKESNLGVAIDYSDIATREAAKKLGAVWDAKNKQWLAPNQETADKLQQMATAGRQKTVDRRQKETASRNAPPALQPGERVFSKDTESKTGYQVGQMVRDKDGKLWVITHTERPQKFEDGFSMGSRVDDGYSHYAHARPATEKETATADRAARITSLEKELRILGVGPDDERDRAEHDTRYRQVADELASLRGQA